MTEIIEHKFKRSHSPFTIHAIWKSMQAKSNTLQQLNHFSQIEVIIIFKSLNNKIGQSSPHCKAWI